MKTKSRRSTSHTAPISIFSLPAQGQGPIAGNRRFTPRLSTSFIARTNDGAVDLEGLDISFQGLMCTGKQITWPGNMLDLALLLPGEPEAVVVKGQVVELVSFRGRVAMRVRFGNDEKATHFQRIAGWMAKCAEQRASL